MYLTKSDELLVESNTLAKFVRVPHSLIKSKELAPLEKLVLIYIMSYQVCWASHKKIAEDTGGSISSVRRSLCSLQQKGLVKITRSKHKSNTYTVVDNYVDNSKTGCSHRTPPLFTENTYPCSQRATNNINTNKIKIIKDRSFDFVVDNFSEKAGDALKKERRRANEKAHLIYLETMRSLGKKV